MNFQVPQFIEVEDKIFGPLTFKQFAYLVGGAGSCFILYAYVGKLSVFLAILLMIPIGGFFLALAFQKINGRPVIIILEAAVKYLTTKKLYLWQRDQTKPIDPKASTLPIAESPLPKLSASKLKDLSWSLDIDKNL